MKLIRTLATAVIMAISVSATAVGKDFTPTTTWPYIYENFQEGCVTNLRGSEIKHEQLNISLVQGKAHYIQNGKLMEVDTRTVSVITIGEDTYVPASGRLVRILTKTEHGTIAVSVTIDTEAMNRSEAGYGGSTVASVREITPRTLSGMASTEARNISELSKTGGDPLELKKTRGIVYRGMFITASKPAVLNIGGIDKDAVKKFMKDNKIRMSEDEDLLRLAEFIGTL